MPPVRPEWRGALVAASLPLLLPLLPLAGAAQTQWARLSSASPSGGPSWQPLPTANPGSTTPEVQWQPLPEATGVPGGAASVIWEPLAPSEQSLLAPAPAGPTPAASATDRLQPPLSAAEAADLLNGLEPLPADYPPLLRLGPAVPTANQLGEQQGQISGFTLSPFSGGSASGTGNQNYSLRIDAGLTDQLQLSGFYANADDPLYAPISGRSSPPANFWESYGVALQWQLLNTSAWKLGLAGSLETWNVGSGGCDSFSCKGNDSASPNIFNSSGSRVYTRNLVGSLALPLTWQAAPQWQLSFSPGISFLPASQGAGQGGAGSFYGNNAFISGGISWQPSRQLSLFSSALLPLGPGSNSFNADLVYSRVPIVTAGLNWALNPRIALEGTLTNGWGATPATALLALPSSNRLGYFARFAYTPAAPDTPQPQLSPRQRSLASGGLTVNTALVPPDGTTQLWANADSSGNVFGYAGYSISNILQLDLFKGGAFNNVPQSTALADTYANDRAPQWRFGGKAVILSPLRGFPIWVGGRISLGREYPPGSGQGYLFAESISTWEASPSLALQLNPKLAWSGVDTPWAIGLGANIQLGRSFQLIPEANLVGSDLSQSNASLALRWLASKSVQFDVYVSNAAGLLDMGQLLDAGQARLGGRLVVSF
ncbi:MAG TPA: hypothetical protein DDY43_02405 [Synechococcales bacterium UBA10510]|nr:hypothetical protein [Synechococcales bacterium UBA10510]